MSASFPRNVATEAKPASFMLRVRNKTLSHLNSTFRLVQTIYQKEHWWAEFWSGLVLVSWAATDTVSSTPIQMNPRFAVLVAIMPNSAWEFLAAVIGAQQLGALLLDKPLGRFLAAGAATWFFSVVTMSIIYTSPGFPPAGMVLVIGWVGLNLFATGREFRKILR